MSFTCTPETPWHEGIKERPVFHTGAEELDQEDGYPGGDIVRMRCGTCVFWEKWEDLDGRGICNYKLIIPKAFYGLSYQRSSTSDLNGVDCQAWSKVVA